MEDEKYATGNVYEIAGNFLMGVQPTDKKIGKIGRKEIGIIIFPKTEAIKGDNMVLKITNWQGETKEFPVVASPLADQGDLETMIGTVKHKILFPMLDEKGKADGKESN